MADLELDLRHHTLTGSGGGVGVGILDGSKLQLSNGTIQKWAAGISFDATGDGYPSGSATVSDVSFRSNGAGSTGGIYATLAFTRVMFLNNGNGIVGPWYGNTTVSTSIFRGNKYAANMFDSTLTMAGSIVDHNGTGVNCANLSCHLTGNSVSNNTTGLSIRNTGEFDMTKNIFRRNGVGIDAGGYSSSNSARTSSPGTPPACSSTRASEPSTGTSSPETTPDWHPAIAVTPPS